MNCYKQNHPPQSFKKITYTWNLFLAISLFFFSNSTISEDLDKILDVQEATNKASSTSQKKIDKLDEQKIDLLSDYKQAVRQTESLRVYNHQLEKMVKSQRSEINSINSQIEQIDQTNIDITPLMLKMVSSLEEFVHLDIPFLQEERQQRIAQLKLNMDRADITTSEKYRKILEAYQIENDYGRTIEAYKGGLDIDGKSHTYQFLRVGRVALLYQSLDGKESGHWNILDKKFEPLGPEYTDSIRRGLKIARKQAPPSLIKLPTPAAEEAAL